MFKVFYNTTTGRIVGTGVETSDSVTVNRDEPYLLLENEINTGRVKVNLTTLTLEDLPESEWPPVWSR
jgi:hypothetical protein